MHGRHPRQAAAPRHRLKGEPCAPRNPSTGGSEIAVFDADNHYWEVSDSFTRYRDPAFADRGVVLKEVDGKPHYFFGERAHPIIPGPGDVHPRPRPGALYDYFAGKSSKERVGNELACEEPAAHPEWFNRDARLACMDAQGVEAAWLFPSQGVCMEGPMQPDIEASIEVLRAFNRWLDDDWGFAYQDRIFAVPFLTLSDLDRAVKRARVVPRPRRPRHHDPQRTGFHA